MQSVFKLRNEQNHQNKFIFYSKHSLYFLKYHFNYSSNLSLDLNVTIAFPFRASFCEIRNPNPQATTYVINKIQAQYHQIINHEQHSHPQCMWVLCVEYVDDKGKWSICCCFLRKSSWKSYVSIYLCRTYV